MSSELTGEEPAGLEESSQQAPRSSRELSAREASQMRSQLASVPEGSGEAGQAEAVMLGARHDFTVKDTSQAIRCKCVAAVLGAPSSGKLAWQGEMPRTKPETQLVLGLVPEARCEGLPQGAGGASYWGYRMEGGDVVVLLEDWNTRRPRTLGAIIPKPVEGSQVYLAPADPRFPYGSSLTDTGRCALGNPGPKRSVEEPR